MDQNDHDDSHAAVEPFLNDRRVRYLRQDPKGLSAARNLAISLSRGDIVALTDDDCELPGDFLTSMAAAFAVDPRIAIVYGNVLPPPDYRWTSFIPTRIRAGAYLARTVSQAPISGMGACMALRRDAWDAIGGFDEMLGVGAPLGAGEEFDLAVRALLAGFYVYETDEVAVVHHALHPWSARDAIVGRYYFGTGAAVAKHLRCCAGPASMLAVRLAARWAFRQPGIDVVRPLDRLHRLTAFLRGVVVGMTMSVDRPTVCFGSR